MTSEAHALNLTPKRGPSIWDDEQWNAACRNYNVGLWLLGIGGGALLAIGATRGSTARRIASVAGAAAALSIATGRVSVDEAAGWVRRIWRGVEGGDRVEDDSMLSFPASDAPAWTATTGTGTPGR
jgi:uncharacterized membrane protein